MKPQEDIIPFPAEPSRALERTSFARPLVRGAADSFFRRWKWVSAFWALATVALAAYLALAPRQYEAEMTFLVKNVRTEPVLSGENGAQPLRSADVTDAQIATEVQMLASRELAEIVLPETGFWGGTPQLREKALAKLQKSLQIMPVMKSAMIRVRYSSTDAAQSRRVLDALAKAYLNRHVELHSNSGSLQFFEQQSGEAKARLEEAQNELLKFQTSSGVVSASEQKELLLQKAVELKVALNAAEAEYRDASRKAVILSQRMGGVPSRIATQKRTMSNQYSVERMNTMLVELRNKRTELLTKFRPTERAVTQIDQQIADTEKALRDAESKSAGEEASDVNPLRQTLETEFTRTDASAAGLRSRIAAMREQEREYRRELARLESLIPLEQKYQRDAKVAEENYLLYAKKQEEARIGERMDRQKIANVVLAESPREPATPKGRMGTVLPAYLLALVTSIALVGIFTRHPKRVQTPWELESIALVPVLGTVPAQARRIS